MFAGRRGGSPGRVRFDFPFAPAYRVAALPFGITPGRAWVEVDDDRLRIRFGPWRTETPVANVMAVHRTGGYAFLKTAGPAHLSLADRGITFASNGERGLCLELSEPARVELPVGRLHCPGITVTVADLDGLARALGQPVS